jgi:hypothetical protein
VTEQNGQQPAAGHSKAFETLVENADDLVGLIAYALYKQSLREDAEQGKPVAPSHSREPTATLVKAFRGDAERRLQNFASVAFEEAAPGLIVDAFGGRLDTAVIEINQTIKERTSMKSAVVSNMVAWALTIVATFLIVGALYLPDWRSIGMKLSGGG